MSYNNVNKQNRLKELRRRVLSFDYPSKIIQKVVQDDNSQECAFSRVTYPKIILPKKPLTDQQQKDQADEEYQRSKLNQSNQSVSEKENDEEEQEEKVSGDKQVVINKIEDKKIIQPRILNFQHDKFGKDTFIRNLNGKFEMRSDYVAYEPTEDTKEVCMERRWIDGRQRELREKRENEEMIKIMQSWSVAKGRVEKEINRKIDSSIFGSKFKDCGYRHNKLSSDQLKQIDSQTKDIALKMNVLQELEADAMKEKRIQIKLKAREARRIEKQEKLLKDKKKMQQKGGYGSDSDEEINPVPLEVDDSYDEDLDGPKTKLLEEFKMIDASKNQSKIVNLHVRTFTRSVDNIENQASKQKIQNIKLLYGNIIGINQNSQSVSELNRSESLKTNQNRNSVVQNNTPIQQNVNPPNIQSPMKKIGISSSSVDLNAGKDEMNSLSIYQKNVFKSQKQFSAVLNSAQDAVALHNEHIAEIKEIKNRMVKYKIPICFKILKNAIIIPEGLIDQDDVDNIPQPGDGLLPNPFLSEKKKKKKNKKH